MNEWTDGRHLMPRETVVLATSQRTTDQALRPNSCQASAGLHTTVRVTCGRYVQHCVEKPGGTGETFPTFDGTQKFPPVDQCQLNPFHILAPGFCNILCTSSLPYCSLFLGFVDPVCVSCMCRVSACPEDQAVPTHTLHHHHTHFQKLIIAEVVNKDLEFCGHRWFVTVFTKARHLLLF